VKVVDVAGHIEIACRLKHIGYNERFDITYSFPFDPGMLADLVIGFRSLATMG
jgi:hypothetical protein